MFSFSEGHYSGRSMGRVHTRAGVVGITSYGAGGGDLRWHCHENFHVSYVFEGAGESQSRGRSEGPADGVFVYGGGERHRWIPRSATCRGVNVELSPESLAYLGCSESQAQRSIRRSRDTKFLMLKMQQEVLCSEADSAAALHVLLGELIRSAKGDETARPPEWVPRVRELLHDRWDASVSLDELAVVAGVHPVTISRSFRRHFACGFGEYRRKLKVERSLDMIKNSSRSLTQVAVDCGFADQSHFIRSFRTVVGMLPREFRRL